MKLLTSTQRATKLSTCFDPLVMDFSRDWTSSCTIACGGIDLNFPLRKGFSLG